MIHRTNTTKPAKTLWAGRLDSVQLGRACGTRSCALLVWLVLLLVSRVTVAGLSNAIWDVGDESTINESTIVGYAGLTGGLWIAPPLHKDFASITVESAAGIFDSTPWSVPDLVNLDGPFDGFSDAAITKAASEGSFGWTYFGNVTLPGLTWEFVLHDLTVNGRFADGTDTGDVLLQYIPLSHCGGLEAVLPGGTIGDDQQSIIYDPRTGDVAVEIIEGDPTSAPSQSRPGYILLSASGRETLVSSLPVGVTSLGAIAPAGLSYSDALGLAQK